MSKIMVATPCYGRVVNESYLRSIMATQEAINESGHKLSMATFGNESLITRARNNFVAAFLDSDCDMLMFIDADIGWRPKAILDLVESDFDVCGIPYPIKGYDWDSVKRLAEKSLAEGSSPAAEDYKKVALKFTVNTLSPQPQGLKEGWFEVTALGTGFLLIRRGVLEKMRTHYWEELRYVNDVKGYLKSIKPENCVGIFETMIEPETRRYLSEDYAFCRRWRDIGGRVFACVQHRLSHTGAHQF